MGIVLGTFSGEQDLRYVFSKFSKNYNNFDLTNEDFLQIVEMLTLCIFNTLTGV